MYRRILPYVMVAILSSLLTAMLQPWAYLQALAQPGCQTFKETGKTVCGRFLQYWQQNGGLAQQGFPISNEFVEVSELNGQSYAVQYFERAVFERHPENKPPYDVLLSQLGRFQFNRKYPDGSPSGTNMGTIKIVSSLPRTGLSSRQTDDIVQAMRMALEEHRSKAGNFSIAYEDWDDSTPESGRWDAAKEAANAQKAISDPDIMVYLGTFNSGAAKVSIPILNEAGLAMISPSNSAPELTKSGFDNIYPNSLYPTGKRNYFRVSTADDVQAIAEANWATELGFKKAYVLHDNETYGKGTARVFEKQFKTRGGTVTANEAIDYKQTQFKTLMSKVKASGADLVYFGGLVDTGGPQLLKDLRAVAPNIAFMGPDGIQTSEFIYAAGESIAEGALASVAWRDLQDLPPKVVQFNSNFKTKYGIDPDPYAVYGYEAMNIALDAIARAGKKDRAAILDAVAATRNYDGVFGVRSFDANGDVTPNDISLYKVQGGKWMYQKYMTVP